MESRTWNLEPGTWNFLEALLLQLFLADKPGGPRRLLRPDAATRHLSPVTCPLPPVTCNLRNPPSPPPHRPLHIPLGIAFLNILPLVVFRFALGQCQRNLGVPAFEKQVQRN